MMCEKAPETWWATHKRQVINLWNCCILLVNLFESYDDARTYEHQMCQVLRRIAYSSWRARLLVYSGILKSVFFFLPRFVSWHYIFNAVNGSAWTTLTYLDQVSGLNTYIGCRHLTRPGFVTGPKSRAASNIQIVKFDIHRTCIHTTCENGYNNIY